MLPTECSAVTASVERVEIAGNAAHAPDRAPQSAPIAKKIHEDINRLLSREVGYRATTDTEFANLTWEGVSEGGPAVELRQCLQCQPAMQSETYVDINIATCSRICLHMQAGL